MVDEKVCVVFMISLLLLPPPAGGNIPAGSIVAVLRFAILSLASLDSSFLKEPCLARFASLLHTALFCHRQGRCSGASRREAFQKAPSMRELSPQRLKE
jgi:hypothetical protein